MALVLRTCKSDLSSYGGFRWPSEGPVECPDWDPTPECGRGLHGLLGGCGDGSLLDWSESARWLVVDVNDVDIVDLGRKVKFARGLVVHCGDQKSATDYLISHGCTGPIVGASVVVGDYGHATAGYRGQATVGYSGQSTAGDYGHATAGYKGHATAGDYGHATAGYKGHATVGDGGQATAGDGGHATAGDCGHATAGDYGQATAGSYGQAMAGDDGKAMAGDEGQATAGEGGEIHIRYYDDSSNRYRTRVGYIGEGGLKAGVSYRLNADHEFEEVA